MPRKYVSGINPRAVKAFLERPVDDWSWLKGIPKAEILKQLHAIKPTPNTTDLMKQQLIGLLIGIAIRQFCFFYGPGAAKTLLILRLLEYFQQLGEFKKGVVFVPSVEAVYAWHDEMIKWKSPIRPIPLTDGGSIEKTNKWLVHDEGLVICAYPSFSAMGSNEVIVKDKTKRVMVPVRKKIERLFRGVDATIGDELTEIGNHDSLQARCCSIAASVVPIRYGLAGRPYGRDPQLQWNQQKIIDGGVSLGPTLGLMRAALFEAKKNEFGGAYSFDYTLSKEKQKDFTRAAGHRSLIYKTEECVDLPELSQITRRIPFPPETLAYYQKIKEHLIANHTDRITVNNDFLRMRQLGSGFLGIVNDEYGAKAEIKFDANPKLDVMMELINQFQKTPR